MGERPKRWDPGARNEAYAELEHPADLFVEVWGRDLPDLFENALFALYDQMAELEGFRIERAVTIEVSGPDPEETLRSLLSEALYRFATEGFVATRAELDVKAAPEGPVWVTAHLHGETIDRRRHTLLTEVKAVTYHRLTVERNPEGGWRATVLFDV
ncbi:MAG: archease [Thermoleophilia bacterium]|nr:archease [Thermoleophilia bacterium]